jgi:hypothetical protein
VKQHVKMTSNMATPEHTSRVQSFLKYFTMCLKGLWYVWTLQEKRSCRESWRDLGSRTGDLDFSHTYHEFLSITEQSIFSPSVKYGDWAKDHKVLTFPISFLYWLPALNPFMHCLVLIRNYFVIWADNLYESDDELIFSDDYL